MEKSLISVIVPTKNSENFLRKCLKSIQNQNYENIEIIVVDNNSTDKTKELVLSLSKTKNLRTKTYIYNKGPERSAQRNYGAQKASGDYLLFLDSDMELSKEVISDCVDKINKQETINKDPRSKTQDLRIGGIIIPEESFGEGFWAECKRLERSFYVGVGWMEAARFFPKDVFNEFNGFDQGLISGEDWDLNQRIRSKHEISRINSFIEHNEGRLSLINLLKKKMYYGTKINNYSSKEANSKDFKKQSSIIERYKLFLSHPFKLFKNPVVGVGMLFMKTCEFAAVGLGQILKL